MAKYYTMNGYLYAIIVHHGDKSRRNALGKAMDNMLGMCWNASGKNVT